MAKSKKKTTKKTKKQSLDTSGMKIAAALTSVIDEDDDDDDDERTEDMEAGGSESEEGSDDERKHNKLLEAISSLGGRKRKKLAERSEATVQMSEFTVNAEGEGDRVHLSDLIGTIEKTPAVSVKTKKQLKNLQQRQATLACPLSKQQTERIQRQVAFQKTAEEVSRWQSVVKQNQKAEQLVFPLNQEPSGPRTIVKLVAGWKAQTPLEQEIFSILHANNQPIHDPVLTPEEEVSMRAMSLDEAKTRRAELQKARVLQSFYEAKAKRQKKIKSKMYHKVQNKAKRKDFMKQFDEMVKTDPAAALEELNKIEMSRMQERMSLKHQNSGKWAKSKAIMAKYDEGARKAMQQQLEVNKELTQKLVNPLNVEEEEEEEEAEVLPDFVNDAEPVLDPSNPWMRGKLSAEQDAELGEDSAAAAEPGMVSAPNEQEEEEEEEQEPAEEVLLRQFEAKRKLRQVEEFDTAPTCLSDGEDTEPVEDTTVEAVTAEPGILSNSEEQEKVAEQEPGEEMIVHQPEDSDPAPVCLSNGKAEQAAEPEIVSNSEEQEKMEEQKPEEEVPEPEKIVHQPEDSDAAPVCLSNGKDAEQAAEPGIVVDSEEQEKEEEEQAPGEPEEDEDDVLIRTFEIVRKLRQSQTEESDTTPICVDDDSKATTEAVAPPPAAVSQNKKRKRRRGIDMREVLTKESKLLTGPLAPTAIEDENTEEQMNIIKEAFAGDDVIGDFLKDKKRQEEAGRPKDLNMTLPGWGEWGGLGLKPSRRKRRRFTVKAAPAAPRRDEKLPTVIISETRNSSVCLHQVNSLPHPFETRGQFESTIRCPTGHTWNTQQTVRKITAPKIITRRGAIIGPITREALDKDKK